MLHNFYVLLLLFDLSSRNGLLSSKNGQLVLHVVGGDAKTP